MKAYETRFSRLLPRASCPGRRHRARPGFSLLEIMIAIIILGIGMVMVATVFPVGLEVSRKTIQMEVSTAVVDSAVSIMKVKAPAPSDLDGVMSPAAPRVAVPDVLNTDFGSNMDAVAGQMLESPDPTIWPCNKWFSLTNWAGCATPLGIPANEYLNRSRVYTELTGWSDLSNVTNQHDYAVVMPMQNIPTDYRTRMVPFPVIPTPRFVIPSSPSIPRIHISERVFPTVSLSLVNPGTPSGFPTVASGAYELTSPLLSEVIDPIIRDSVDPAGARLLGNIITVGDDARGESARRYAWDVIHHRISSSPGQSDVLATIVVLHRADLSARFARQLDQSQTADFSYNLNNPNDVNALLLPEPDADEDSMGLDLDTYIPQPWLVILSSIDGVTGEITCTQQVGRLLPTGSFFIVAARNGDYFAGTAHQIIDAEYDQSLLDPTLPQPPPPASLRIAPGGANVNNLLVWVYPPAVTRDQKPVDTVFGGRSPVTGVALRKVSPG